MSFTFRPAVFKDVHLLIGIAGGTRSGKTWSAMRLATGLAGDKPFAVIDTENERALHYADDFKFNHCLFAPPFTQEGYLEAVQEAARQGNSVIVIDSFSQVWDGIGGMLEQSEAELDRMAGNDFAKRDRCMRSSWIKPKAKHNQLLQRLTHVNAHLIFCIRAEVKSEMVRAPDGKVKLVPMTSPIAHNGWVPICDKKLPWELTAYLLLTRESQGVPASTWLMGRHQKLFPPGQLIDEKAGRALAGWSGGAKPDPKAAEPTAFAATCITSDQARQIEEYAESLNVDVEAFNAWLTSEWSSQRISELPAHAFDAVMVMLVKKEHVRRGAPEQAVQP